MKHLAVIVTRWQLSAYWPAVLQWMAVTLGYIQAHCTIQAPYKGHIFEQSTWQVPSECSIAGPMVQSVISLKLTAVQCTRNGGSSPPHLVCPLRNSDSVMDALQAPSLALLLGAVSQLLNESVSCRHHRICPSIGLMDSWHVLHNSSLTTVSCR